MAKRSKVTKEMIELMFVLSNPQRMRMAELLGTNETQTIEQLTEGCELRPPGVHAALMHFRTFDLVDVARKEGRLAFYALDRKTMAERFLQIADVLGLDLGAPASNLKPAKSKKSKKKKKKKKKKR